jgi:hypothetical protein
MPLVRIDISKTASCERVRDVGDAVYNAMIAVAKVPEYDRFQVVTRHEPDEIRRWNLGRNLSRRIHAAARRSGCARTLVLQRLREHRPGSPA